MNKEILDKMLVDNNILYIYNLPASLYDISEDWDKYIIIVKDINIFNYSKEDICIYDISNWFKMVLTGNILCWQCACLPKKYVIKEYVKILMHSDPIQLRKDFDSFLEICHNDLDIEVCRELLIFVKFSVKSLKSIDVVKYTLKKIKKNKLIIIPSLSIKLGVFANRLLPRKTIVKIIYKIQQSKKIK